LKIETIRSSGGSSLSYCPERGGIITSIILRGTEILYLDQEAFENPEVNVKGGIPILFPNAGPIPDPATAPAGVARLKQHGFVRQSSRWIHATYWNKFTEDMTDDNETMDCYPYQFMLSIIGEIGEDACSIDARIYNPSAHSILPVSMGFHPYFRVPKGIKEDIEFRFEGGNEVKAGFDMWSNGKAISIANPRLHSPLDSLAMEVFIPGLGHLFFDSSIEYRRIWVWSLPGKDFICIEPVMRDKGGIVTDPMEIKPKGEIWAGFGVRLLQ